MLSSFIGIIAFKSLDWIPTICPKSTLPLMSPCFLPQEAHLYAQWLLVVCGQQGTLKRSKQENVWVRVFILPAPSQTCHCRTASSLNSRSWLLPGGPLDPALSLALSHLLVSSHLGRKHEKGLPFGSLNPDCYCC